MLQQNCFKINSQQFKLVENIFISVTKDSIVFLVLVKACQLNKLTAVCYASVLLLIMNFVKTLSK